RQHHLDTAARHAQGFHVELAQVESEVGDGEDDRPPARWAHRVAGPLRDRPPDGRLFARIRREVDLLVEGHVQRLQPRHLADLEHQRGRIGEPGLAVRELPGDSGAEREREQDRRHREKVAHARSIPDQGCRSFSYIDSRGVAVTVRGILISEAMCQSASFRWSSPRAPLPPAAPTPTTTRCRRSSWAPSPKSPTTAPATISSPPDSARRASPARLRPCLPRRRRQSCEGSPSITTTARWWTSPRAAGTGRCTGRTST